MLFDMIAALFRRKKPAADQPRQELAWRVDRAAPRQPFPEGKLACVFRGATLISTSSDAVPARVGEGETCWLLPAADVGMLIDVEIGAEVVSSLVEVRFEVDGLLGELLRKRDALRQEDVAALVSSELGGLLDLLGHVSVNELTAADEANRERLRAKLSLLLQSKGFRCTALGTFHVRQPEEAAPAALPAAEEQGARSEEQGIDLKPDGAPACGSTGTKEQAVPPAQLEAELCGAIRKVKNDAQWESLMGELETAGFAVDSDQAAELTLLGEAVVDGDVNAAKAAARVRAIAEDAARRAGVVRPDVNRYSGLSLRLGLLGEETPYAAAPADDLSADETADPVARTARVGSRPVKRPWTWWIFGRGAVDARLQGFLSECVGRSRALVDHCAMQSKDLKLCGRLRDVGNRFQLVSDLLATVPTLQARPRKLRPDRARTNCCYKAWNGPSRRPKWSNCRPGSSNCNRPAVRNGNRR